MRDKFVFESFNDFINYKMLLAEAETEPQKGAESKTNSWEFKFDSGKFKREDVTPEQIKKLDDDFQKKIVPLFNNQNYIGQKLEINISAASSKVPINPTGSVAKELKAAGYAPTNEGLCKARGNTVVNIIKDMIYDKFGDKGDKAKFFKALDKKMTLVNKPLPNIGPDYDKSKGDNADDQKYKDNQYISATLVVKGERIPDEFFISCKMDKSFSGKQASAANGFVGYDETVYLKAKAGQVMTISFDPVTIPDAILFYYSENNFKLAPFSGSYGAIYVKGDYSKEKEDAWNKDAALGKVATAKKQTISGRDYLVIDYKDYINNVANKGGILVKSIESKLKSLGLKSIKDVCPEFFDANGKIEVYRNKDLIDNRLVGTEDPSRFTYNLLKSGKIKESPKADTDSFSIDVTKNAVRDAVTLIAFSPISGTAFHVRTKCD